MNYKTYTNFEFKFNSLFYKMYLFEWRRMSWLAICWIHGLVRFQKICKENSIYRAFWLMSIVQCRILWHSRGLLLALNCIDLCINLLRVLWKAWKMHLKCGIVSSILFCTMKYYSSFTEVVQDTLHNLINLQNTN